MAASGLGEKGSYGGVLVVGAIALVGLVFLNRFSGLGINSSYLYIALSLVLVPLVLPFLSGGADNNILGRGGSWWPSGGRTAADHAGEGATGPTIELRVDADPESIQPGGRSIISVHARNATKNKNLKREVVTLEVSEGNGRFDGNQERITLRTNRQGRATANFDAPAEIEGDAEQNTITATLTKYGITATRVIEVALQPEPEEPEVERDILIFFEHEQVVTGGTQAINTRFFNVEGDAGIGGATIILRIADGSGQFADGTREFRGETDANGSLPEVTYQAPANIADDWEIIEISAEVEGEGITTSSEFTLIPPNPLDIFLEEQQLALHAADGQPAADRCVIYEGILAEFQNRHAEFRDEEEFWAVRAYVNFAYADALFEDNQLGDAYDRYAISRQCYQEALRLGGGP